MQVRKRRGGFLAGESRDNVDVQVMPARVGCVVVLDDGDLTGHQREPPPVIRATLPSSLPMVSSGQLEFRLAWGPCLAEPY